MTHALYRGAVIAALVCVTAPAAAETGRIEASGEAEVSDPSARARALDMAFADAVSQALDELVGAEARRRHQAVLHEQVVRRARIYIGAYKVIEETTRGSLLRVSISARVDVDSLRDKLAALRIATSGQGAGSTTAGSSAGPARPGTRQSRSGAVLLLRASVNGEVTTTFGNLVGDGGAVGRTMARLVREQGFELAPLAGVRMPAVDRDRAVPVDDETAGRVAEDAGASAAFVIGVNVGRPGLIRGTGQFGTAGRAVVRVLDVGGRTTEVVASAEVSSAGLASTPGEAVQAATENLARQIMAAVAEPMAATWPASVPADGALLIEVQGHTGWQSIDAILDHLARTRGIARAWPRRLGARGVTLAVDTALSRNQVASALRLMTLPVGQLEVSSGGDKLQVTLSNTGAVP